MYNPAPYPEQALPVYKNVPGIENVLLIGTAHDVTDKPRPKVRKFLDEILGSDHLILEGNKAAAERLKRNRELSNSYEAMALTQFKGPVHFLEESSDYVALLEKYGLRKELAGFYLLFHLFHEVIRQGGTLKEAPEVLKKVILDIVRTGQELAAVNVSETINQYARFCQLLATRQLTYSKELASIMGKIFPQYQILLRDYEAICPNSEKLIQSLEGQRTILTGAAHTDRTAETLSGRKLERPPQWQEQVASLPQNIRETVMNLELMLTQTLPSLS